MAIAAHADSPSTGTIHQEVSPSHPRSGPPHLRHVSCWSGKVSYVSTRTSLYCAAHFGQSNGVASVTGMVLARA